ncbi:MAG: hypothetical protein HC853_10065 [Anaerolineae bacterium]|nr:hypothetical protein [Anaerolineae bacterium]
MPPKSQQKVSEKKQDLFSRNAIRDALKRFHSASQLADHPLASLASIALDNADTQRGLLLREALRAGIESQRPKSDVSGPPNFGEKRWRPYIILSEQYIANRKPDYLADALGLVRGTFHQEQARALEMLGEHLREREAAYSAIAKPAPSDMTLVLSSSVPFLARRARPSRWWGGRVYSTRSSNNSSRAVR